MGNDEMKATNDLLIQNVKESKALNEHKRSIHCLLQLENGDYSLDYTKIPRNNIFIIPDYLKVKEGSDIFKGWKYIDFIKYFRDQCYSGYYD